MFSFTSPHDMTLEQLAEKVEIITIIYDNLVWLYENDITTIELDDKIYSIVDYIKSTRELLYTKDIDITDETINNIKSYKDIRIFLNSIRINEDNNNDIEHIINDNIMDLLS